MVSELFPQESISVAREIAKKYKLRSRSRREQAIELYRGKFLEIKYGFDEAIRTGKCGRYLHEIIKEAECFTFAGAIYLVARELGLKPEIYRAVNMTDWDEGENPEDKPCGGEHPFIIVEIKKGQKEILDPLWSKFGKVFFKSEKNLIEIHHPNHQVSFRSYSYLQQLSEKEYKSLIEQHRTPEGGRHALRGTQKLTSIKKLRIYITYIPGSEDLQASLRGGINLAENDPYQRETIADLVTRIDTFGNFNFHQGTLKIYDAKAAGWDIHRFPQAPFILHVKDAENIWMLYEEIFRAKGRKQAPIRTGLIKLRQLVRESGLNNDFSIQADSLIEKIVNEGSLEEKVKEIQERQKIECQRFLTETKKDEVSYRIHLRHAHYIKAKDQKTTAENPWGFLYSKEEHLSLLKESCQSYEKMMKSWCEEAIKKTRINIGLDKGSKSHTARKFAIMNVKSENLFDNFRAIVDSYNPRDSLPFQIQADMRLFYKKFDIEHVPLSELESGMENRDLLRAAQQRFFENLLWVYKIKSALFLPNHQKGLRRILNQETKRVHSKATLIRASNNK